MAKTIYPNLVLDQNKVAHPNILWCMDLFTITLSNKSTITVFFAIDVYSNEIVSYLVSYNNTINSSRICSSLLNQIEQFRCHAVHIGIYLHEIRLL